MVQLDQRVLTALMVQLDRLVLTEPLDQLDKLDPLDQQVLMD